MKKIKLYTPSFLTLLLGGLIYICCRTESLRMFSWFNSIKLSEFIIFIRNYTPNFNNQIPDWIKFSLPDGLWLFSFTSLILITWKNEITSSNIFWLISLPLVALSSEIAQVCSILPGTFDYLDLTMYILGFIFPFTINKKHIKIKL